MDKESRLYYGQLLRKFIRTVAIIAVVVTVVFVGLSFVDHVQTPKIGKGK